jgi:HEPN domain-containing protein
VQAQTTTASTTDAAGLIPGDAFYFLDKLGESIANLFAAGDIAKAERAIKEATERLAEARKLLNNGKSEEAKASMEKYQAKLDESLEKAQKAQDEGKDVDALLQKISDSVTRHQQVLADVLAKAPEAAKEGIRNAIEKSMHGRDVAIRAISGNKPATGNGIGNGNSTSSNATTSNKGGNSNSTSTKTNNGTSTGAKGQTGTGTKSTY